VNIRYHSSPDLILGSDLLLAIDDGVSTKADSVGRLFDCVKPFGGPDMVFLLEDYGVIIVREAQLVQNSARSVQSEFRILERERNNIKGIIDEFMLNVIRLLIFN